MTDLPYFPPSKYATGAMWQFTDPTPYAEGVTCHVKGCEDSASHKVEEQTDDERHPLTAYLCCSHFGLIMGAFAKRLCERARQFRDNDDQLVT